MKTTYLLFALAASSTATASPLLGGSDINIYGDAKPKPNTPSRAPDPPPAPSPFPLSTDGELSDGSIINYTPDNDSNRHHSCWTAPKSRPSPTTKYANGTCTICMVRRQGTDQSSDYQLWARDDENNAMGNLYATTLWPIDAAESPSDNVRAAMLMGGSDLLIQAELTNPPASAVQMRWVLPPGDSTDPGVWQDKTVPTAMYDPAIGSGNTCTESGSALEGAVRYVICFMSC